MTHNPNVPKEPALNETLSVRVERPLLEKLNARCAAENVSLSHLVRRLLEQPETPAENAGWSIGASGRR